jgi:hypothetical protein
VSGGTNEQKNELFWALMELKEQLWLAWTVWGKGNDVARNTTLRLIEQALDLVQYQEALDFGELRTVLNDIAAMAPDKRLDDVIAALKQISLRQDGDAPSR